MADETFELVDPVVAEQLDAVDAGDSESLFERNMAAFKKKFPDIWRQLEHYRPTSRLHQRDDGQYTVLFKDFDLYPEGHESFGQRQIDALDLHSTRLSHTALNEEGLDQHSRAPFAKMREAFDAAGYHFTEHPSRPQSYFTFVFGVGLGPHLDGLVEHSSCRVLVLVESNLDFIYHSMSVYDWAALIERMEERGSIRLFVGNDPTLLSKHVHSVFRMHNPTALDGTRIFRHYSSAIYFETERALKDSLRTAIMGLGFFQDEINMIGQTYKNLEGGKARLVERMTEHPGLPAFIIGTGPSLENLIDFIGENRDKAILFACGTSIDVLMKHGITPDFWVMMERSVDIFDQARETHELYDTSEVRFAGSTTIYPGVPDFFKEAIFFFRPGLSPAPIFSQHADQVASIPDPLAANAGMSFALHVGFREFYFLGVDVGSRYQSHGHAKGSWYERHDAENIKNLSIPLPGNFGGTVWTTSELQWSKESLEKLTMLHRGRQYFNLGDGALIKGVTPKHPKAVRLPVPKGGKTELLERLVTSCPVYSRADFEDAWERAAVIDRLDEYCAQLKRAMADDEEADDLLYVEETCKLLKTAQANDALAMLLRGTLFTMIIAFEYWQNRLADAEDRIATKRIFATIYCEQLDAMRDRAIEVFEGLEEGEPWHEFVS